MVSLNHQQWARFRCHYYYGYGYHYHYCRRDTYEEQTSCWLTTCHFINFPHPDKGTSVYVYISAVSSRFPFRITKWTIKLLPIKCIFIDIISVALFSFSSLTYHALAQCAYMRYEEMNEYNNDWDIIVVYIVSLFFFSSNLSFVNRNSIAAMMIIIIIISHMIYLFERSRHGEKTPFTAPSSNVFTFHAFVCYIKHWI